MTLQAFIAQHKITMTADGNSNMTDMPKGSTGAAGYAAAGAR